MVWTREGEPCVAADNPVDIAKLLNKYFYSEFQRPLNDEAYQAWQALSDGECYTSEISEMFLSPSDVRDVCLWM